MKIQHTYLPNVTYKDLESGVISSISWQQMLPYLEKAFVIKPHERLIGITVTEDGIKARIETLKHNKLKLI